MERVRCDDDGLGDQFLRSKTSVFHVQRDQDAETLRMYSMFLRLVTILLLWQSVRLNEDGDPHPKD
jgi:hypothetical protein